MSYAQALLATAAGSDLAQGAKSVRVLHRVLIRTENDATEIAQATPAYLTHLR